MATLVKNVAKANPTMKYKEGISRSHETLEKELLNLRVEQAQNTLEKGIIEFKGKVLSQTGAVKTEEIKLKQAEQNLNDTKFQKDFNVQNILNAREIVLDCQEALDLQRDILKQLQQGMDFLVQLEKELF